MIVPAPAGEKDAEARRYPSVVVVSGGSAGNEILDAFVAHFDKVSFILPVSDNGGSSSEIIRSVTVFQCHCVQKAEKSNVCRVLGGPSLGELAK